ncbi:hypothetical protein LPJ55_001772 [Coemansia sp. RSA 990]|nr:hypothetical protein LPJ68_000993 [Coemansia sp. RSA 1086]KAJ1874069.1 hypothetical protein LPJ55_001772 [Coemansia sp. RSA 990]
MLATSLKTYFVEPTNVTAPDGSTVEIKRLRIRKWQVEEKQKLMSLVKQQLETSDSIDWTAISKEIPGRSAQSCKIRYNKTQSIRIEDIESGTQEELGMKRAGRGYRWTVEEHEKFLTLRSIMGNKWGSVSEMLKTRTAIQCGTHWLGIVRARKRDSTIDQPAAKPPCQSSKFHWTSKETDRLRELLLQHKKFDFQAISKHFKGFSRSRIHYAFEELVNGGTRGRWSKEECRELLKLARVYQNDWVKVSLYMPTRRSKTQCCMMYSRLMMGAHRGYKKWTLEETQRLNGLVDSWQRTNSPNSNEDKLNDPVTRAFQKDIAANRITLSSLPTLKDQPDLAKPKKPIPWTLIALHMDGRSAIQCRNKWNSDRVHDRQPKPKLDSSAENRVYTGPWTQEEDRQLYVLSIKYPRHLKEIQNQLPRYRRALAIMARDRLVKRYVNMLKECRSDWDPLEDDFAEVHMRCEVYAWYWAKMEGYRPDDPYPCPLDFAGGSFSTELSPP